MQYLTVVQIPIFVFFFLQLKITMAFHELVEGECGVPSSLIRLTSHFVKDHGFKEEGIHRPFIPPESFQATDSEQLVKQFIEETSCPQTFRMDNLLQEMREIDQNIQPPVAAPGVVKELTGLDTSWANQYLESGRHFDVTFFYFFFFFFFLHKFTFCNSINII